MLRNNTHFPPGRTFGLLRVLRRLPAGGRNTVYECRCKCGNLRNVTRANLSNGQKSCGCIQKARGSSHFHFKGHGEISLRYWNNLRRHAGKRNRTFKLTIEEAWNLFLAQDRKCKLSGLPIAFRSNTDDATASLDRIDSKRGYVKGNVQWLHKDVNRMKLDHTQEKFISLCELIFKQFTSRSTRA